MLKIDLASILKFRSVSYFNKKHELKFDPPVYEQRYMATMRVLEYEYLRGKIKKIVDYGCAEMKVATLLKRIDGIEHILEVDIDEELLKTNIQRVKPLISDHIACRKHPLRIDVYKGSVNASVNCIKNTDAVIAIELIEHLYPDVLESVPFNIFGFIKPKLAIITTPNAEFNVLFQSNLPNGFRHPDHKFEWTRQQFKDWCLNICKRFSNYEVFIIGIGKAPPDKLQYGYVSQMAIFLRRDMLDEVLVPDESSVLSTNNEEYKLLFSSEFPYDSDNRTNDQKILDESKYHIGRYLSMNDTYWNYEKNVYIIPFSKIFDFVFPLAINENELKTVLMTEKYLIQGDSIIVEPEECLDEDMEEKENLNISRIGEESETEKCKLEEESWD